MAHSNIEIVTAFIDTNGREGLSAAIARYGHADLVWWTAGTGEIQQHIRQLGEIMHANYTDDGATFTIRTILSDGDHVAAEYEGMGQLRNGTVYNNHYHTLFALRDGKIAEVREYHNSAYAEPIWAPIFAAALG